jgi:purine-binding chemotaxis protein CheW
MNILTHEHHDVFAAEAADAERARSEFLTCTLGTETYGIDILQVQEIRELEHVTRVPRTASFVRGVINLRGAIVPIVDLGLMFGFPEPMKLEGASAIVLNVDRRLVGLAVSGVSDVIALADDEIVPSPDLGDRPIAAAIRGIGTRDGTSVPLLDVAEILGRIRAGRE